MNHIRTLSFHTPPDFSFWRTAYSHGWCVLLPFECDIPSRTLTRILALADGTIVHCTMRERARGIHVRAASPRALTSEQTREVRTLLKTCLRLEEDLSPFHAEARKLPQYRWMARARAGRLLRSPTMFEDAVKMICTTNCTWGLTVVMVRALTKRFGATRGSFTAFPTPAALAGASEEELRRTCSTGYRAPALQELSRRVQSGQLNIEGWRTSALQTGALFDEMCSVRGIGPYAAGNLLKLVGRYDYLGLDSWVRKQYSVLHTRGRRVKDTTIERRYAAKGAWRGLFFWLEMTREWHDEKFRRGSSPLSKG